MTTPCDTSPQLLLEFALGDLDAAQTAEMKAHLAGCAACRLEVRSHRTLAEDLRSLPVPEPPADLEEILVRAAIQTRRSMGVRAPRWSASRPRFTWTPILCGATGLAIVAVLCLLLLPGRVLSPSSMGEVVYGTGTRNVNALGDPMKLLSNVRQGWEMVTRFATWIAPLSKALGAALGAVGPMRWTLVVSALFGASFMLWRLTRPVVVKRGAPGANARM